MLDKSLNLARRLSARNEPDFLRKLMDEKDHLFHYDSH